MAINQYILLVISVSFIVFGIIQIVRGKKSKNKRGSDNDNY